MTALAGVLTAIRNALPIRAVALTATIIIMLMLFRYQSEYFLTIDNMMNILSQLPEVGLISLSLTFIIISGAMDLSAGSIVGLSAAILGIAYLAGLNIWASVFLALVVGTACGWLNGFLIARLRMQAIVVTVGTMVLLRGLIYVLTGGRSLSGFPEPFYFLGQGSVLGIPFSFIVFALIFICAHLVLTRTVFGRWVFAIGNNEETLRYSGAPVVQIRWVLFTLSGLLAGLSGVFLASRLASAQATSGEGFALQAITAALLGGANIFGGSGSVMGTFLGLIIIVVLGNGLNMMNVSSIVQSMIVGIFILIAAWLGIKRRTV
jgi:ribose transport system permease protein